MSAIQDVAKEAKVSVATVSRVINNSDKVSEATKQRVQEAIEKLDYHPNAWGRSLRRKESRLILILIPNIANPYYSEIVKGIEDTAEQSGYHTMLCTTDGKKSCEDYYKFLHSGNADGAILLGVNKNDATLPQLAKNYPIVQCCEYCNDDSICHISINNYMASTEIANLLIKLGHRKIGLIGSVNEFVSTELRIRGFKDAIELSHKDIEFCMAFADETYSFESGMEATNQLLEQESPPTAIFAISDILALACIRSANMHHMKVPEELSVVGFDDVSYATMFKPYLTTVSQPCYNLGKKACEAFIHMVNNGIWHHEYLDYEIVVRDSTMKK